MQVKLSKKTRQFSKRKLAPLYLWGLVASVPLTANVQAADTQAANAQTTDVQAVNTQVAKTQAILLAKLQQQLAEHSLVRGNFTQTRTMEMFSQPLVSQGQFLLTQQQGLLWQQTAPFPVKLTLTADKLSQQFGDQPAQVMSASDNPMVFYFSHVFLSLFKGDTSQLMEQFDLTLSEQDNEWQLVLVPTSAPLNAVFRNITIRGDQHINQLRLNEVRGDNTQIDFSHQRTTPAALSAEEQRAFQL
ncbi:outer membrane lipoprotein carrier protein LolA [Photobacterium swingsii]|uniref:Outer membrane lipoprotein carrier protein LolA n=1 Tax=Photobacterium swingsii TaxID=680026 RepID=A0A2T3P2Z3_9GAMM|nr:outer membrane lipoprotein carrier protein LolA [Photobacterium swingsii]PSW22875.1 outer membrane lipoprotein carrier protein LolA [Photobacterium swingsii]